MSALLTESVRRRLAAAGCVAAPSDIYAGEGARFYDEVVGPDRSEIREVLDVARRCGPAVLDLAAGSGRLTVPLVRSGKRVTALDLSTDMLARLRATLSPGASCDLVVADMCDVDLGREFDLIVLGATSITLFDEAGRRHVFATVRRHLASGGTFVLSVPGAGTAEALRESGDREITLGSAVYLQSQQVEPDGSQRIVNWMPLPLPHTAGHVPVLTTRLRIVDHAGLADELRGAGFASPDALPVRTNGVAPGDAMVLLRTRVETGAARVI
jgi:SAM-dependent methyltransferase